MKKRNKVFAFMLAAGLAFSCIGQGSITTEAATTKKAIYILPGYVESRLYGTDGLEIWANVAIVADIAKDIAGKSEMAHDANGLNMKANANRSRDAYGVLNCFLPMINSMNDMLKKNKLDSTYTVEFFSYNWLDDLNVSAQNLSDDIKQKGYDKVILVTHSNGGLLGSAFIAQSAANRDKVERAILIAPPLYGTYTALEPIETGTMTLFDGTLFMSLLQAGYSPFIAPISQHWVKSWAKNSPNTYQLLPSQEYLDEVPAIYKPSLTQTQYINKMSDLWNLLNKSSNVNPKLTNGTGNKSEKYFRETVLKNDILGQWSNVNAPITLIGCDDGFITPYTPVYRTIGSKTFYEGMIYTRKGDGLVPGLSVKGDGRFEYLNYPRAGHITIIADSRVMTGVNQLILGQKPTVTNEPAASMFDMIRLVITSDIGLIFKVTDSSGKQVGIANGEMWQGFSNDKFAYEPLPADAAKTKVLLYLPRKGYKLQLSAADGPLSALNSKTQVSVCELDEDGFNTSETQYEIKGSDLLGNVATFNNITGNNETFEPSQANFTKTSTNTYPDDWTFSKTEATLAKGESLTLTLTGTDAASGKVKPANLFWSSSNTSVATVSSAGVVKAVAGGTCEITALAQDDSFKSVSCKITVTMPVTGVTLTPTSSTLPVGGTLALEAVVAPDSAADKSVTYKTSNATVATVSDNGVIEAKKVGSATITATTNSGSKTATSKVTVIQPVTAITLTPPTVTLTKGKTQTLAATVLPSDATTKTITWTSDDTSVATVSTTGLITAKAAGMTTITATAKDGSGIVASATVTVTTPVTGVTLTPTSSTLPVGDTLTIEAVVAPDSAEDKSVTYKTSDAAVATVSDTGVVEAKKVGSATITVTTNSGAKTATSKVTVIQPVIEITLTPPTVTLAKGKTQILTAAVLPGNATTKTITWTSDNASVATVSTSGIITAKAAGTTTITATAKDGGGAIATVTVTVQ